MDQLDIDLCNAHQRLLRCAEDYEKLVAEAKQAKVKDFDASEEYEIAVSQYCYEIREFNRLLSQRPKP